MYMIMLGIVVVVALVVGLGIGEDSAKKPTTKQEQCDFCHKITKNGVRKPVTDLIYGIIEYGKYDEYEKRLAKYCPLCGRPLNQVADEDES